MAEQKKKKKMPWGTVIYIACCAVIGGIIGVALGMADFDMDPGTLFGIMAAFVVMLYLHIIIHEAGHMVFGLLTGYGFLSYRIGSFMWEKGEDGKVHLSRFAIAGTGGQCLMVPPEYHGGSYPYVWYNLGGAVMNLLVAALAGMVILLCPLGKWGSIILWMLMLVGVLTGLTNGLPIPGNKLNNDGSNAVAISKSPEAKRAFWLQMKTNELGSRNIRLKDMPEEYFAPFPEESRANSMVMTISVMAANRQMDALNFAEAERLMLPLMEDEHVPALYRNLMVFDMAWIELMNDRPGQWMEKLEDKEIKQFAKAMKTYPTVLRTQYAVSLLRDKDEKQAAAYLAAFEKAAAKYPRPADLISEREMLAMTEQKAKEA